MCGLCCHEELFYLCSKNQVQHRLPDTGYWAVGKSSQHLATGSWVSYMEFVNGWLLSFFNKRYIPDADTQYRTFTGKDSTCRCDSLRLRHCFFVGSDFAGLLKKYIT